MVTFGLGAYWVSPCRQGAAGAPLAEHSGSPTLSTTSLTTHMACLHSPKLRLPEEVRGVWLPSGLPSTPGLPVHTAFVLPLCLGDTFPIPMCCLKVSLAGPPAGDRGFWCACGLLPPRAQGVLAVGGRQHQSI